MFFNLFFGDSRLVGFFGRDGQLYWDAVTVYVFLKLNRRRFFTNYATVPVSEVFIIGYIQHFNAKQLEYRLVKDEVFTLLMKENRYKEVKKFYKKYVNRAVYVRISSTEKKPQIILCARQNDHALDFFRWLDEYSRKLIIAASPGERAPILDEQTYSLESPAISPSHSPLYSPSQLPDFSSPSQLPDFSSPSQFPDFSSPSQSQLYSPSQSPLYSPSQSPLYNPSQFPDFSSPSQFPDFSSLPEQYGSIWIYDGMPPTNIYFCHENMIYQYVRRN